MIRTLTALCILALAFSLVDAPAPATAGESLWSHNGSTMQWHSAGQYRRISYYNPRPGLSVSPGTVLFEGYRTGNTMSGTAYVFRRGCPPAAYEVSGRINPANQTHVVLYGAAPIRQRGSCRVVGYSSNSANARLEFNYLQRM